MNMRVYMYLCVCVCVRVHARVRTCLRRLRERRTPTDCSPLRAPQGRNFRAWATHARRRAEVKRRKRKHDLALLRRVLRAFAARAKWGCAVRRVVASEWSEYVYNLRAGPFRRWFLYASKCVPRGAWRRAPLGRRAHAG